MICVIHYVACMADSNYVASFKTIVLKQIHIKFYRFVLTSLVEYYYMLLIRNNYFLRMLNGSLIAVN